MPLPSPGRRPSPALVVTAGLLAAGLLAALTTICVIPGASASAAPQGAPGATRPVGHAGGGGRGHLSRSQRARLALNRAQTAFAWSTPAYARPDASLALRRLYLLKGSLSPTERKVAAQIGARPAADQVDCSSPIACIHWNSSTSTATWAATVRDTINYVGTLYRSSGYKSTLSDGTAGGGPQTDVYIAPLQPGLYGYCKPTGHLKRGTHAAAAFCVLDNDYAGFPAHTPLENLQVTAAHEFFHATQFAYDVLDDTWFLEATAVWMEDQVFPNVNDNLQYLANSPITHPKTSMDTFQSGGSFHYGVWNFFRYLTEKYPTLQGGLPDLVLHMWQQADSTHGRSRDHYSLQAINRTLHQDAHSSLTREFTLYSDATRHTHTTFAEGAALDYPVKRLAGRQRLATMRAGATFRTRLNHLTSASYRLVPAGLGPDAKLRLHFDLAPKATGSSAVVSTYKVDGSVSTKLIRLNAQGNRTKKVLFGSDQVSSVEVTLVNAGTAFRDCYHNRTPYSCYGGLPVDQHEPEVLSATVV